MKIVFLLLLLIISLYANDVKHITINDKDIVLLEESYNLYGSRGVAVSFYIEKKNGDLRFLKIFTTKYKSGDCLNKEIESGVYKVDGKQITFYTLKSIKKKAEKVPFYAEILRYELEDEKFNLIDKKLYSTKRKDTKVLEIVENVLSKYKKSHLSPWNNK